MKVKPIESSKNSLIKKVKGLGLRRAAREKNGQFIIDNLKLIEEFIADGLSPGALIVSKSFLTGGNADRLDVGELFVVDDKLFAELATTETTRGVVATAAIPEFSAADLMSPAPQMLIIVDGVQDPGNLGTIFRTAYAAGASGLVLTRGTVDAYNPKTVRAAAGAIWRLPHLAGLKTEEAINLARDNGLTVIAVCQTGDKALWRADLTGPVALIFGSEGSGLSAPVDSLVDSILSIPMASGSESLNVSIAAAITMFQVVQQRQSPETSC